ncbi:MAG: hypothetical protein Q8O29_06840 [Polaromonas sp.]|uniref:hypothetical protein n=1 Tax=Polaromonas sp. TaxID=1869339 RepID=UPI002732544A|nr:hypothetical protein [Polaromonas sp.]MDP2817988.1 hypothetical protein [Polaromonas sp.]
MHETVAAQPAHAIAAVTHPDPYSYYRQLREERPLYFDASLQLWVASSQVVIAEAQGYPAFNVRPPCEPVPAARQGTVVGEVFVRLVGEFVWRGRIVAAWASVQASTPAQAPPLLSKQ